MTNTASGRGGSVKKKRRRRPPTKPPTPTIPIRISGDLIDRIDAVRPELIPREPYTRHLVEKALDAVEAGELEL